ncbi:MAG: phosphate regulon transcriptional regulator PhoB [Proteobacteria bacterium]|nr:phosphate regulon transcriptional regulator PhoB [Pseudomonadota bacterium]MDE3208882.1 phosphate regulon transcriptional regulator PhoB [Pseudomonadota bacterium]
MAANILVVEDESSIQELLKFNLRQAGHSVWQALNVEEARHAIRNELPDLILLDWMLPGKNGIEFAQQLRNDKRTRDIPIIMLTARTEESDKITGLDIGADDYITKPFSPREVLARIKAVLRRRAPQTTEDIIELQGLKLDPSSYRVYGNGAEIELGPTEFRLLHFLMSHQERVYTRTQLLDRVWGDHIVVEERTVDVHIRRLRLALETTGHEQLIQTVRGAGYRCSAS